MYATIFRVKTSIEKTTDFLIKYLSYLRNIVTYSKIISLLNKTPIKLPKSKKKVL